jgi:hypothetical protein
LGMLSGLPRVYGERVEYGDHRVNRIRTVNVLMSAYGFERESSPFS